MAWSPPKQPKNGSFEWGASANTPSSPAAPVNGSRPGAPLIRTSPSMSPASASKPVPNLSTPGSNARIALKRKTPGVTPASPLTSMPVYTPGSTKKSYPVANPVASSQGESVKAATIAARPVTLPREQAKSQPEVQRVTPPSGNTPKSNPATPAAANNRPVKEASPAKPSPAHTQPQQPRVMADEGARSFGGGVVAQRPAEEQVPIIQRREKPVTESAPGPAISRSPVSQPKVERSGATREGRSPHKRGLSDEKGDDHEIKRRRPSVSPNRHAEAESREQRRASHDQSPPRPQEKILSAPSPAPAPAAPASPERALVQSKAESPVEKLMHSPKLKQDAIDYHKHHALVLPANDETPTKPTKKIHRSQSLGYQAHPSKTRPNGKVVGYVGPRAMMATGGGGDGSAESAGNNGPSTPADSSHTSTNTANVKRSQSLPYPAQSQPATPAQANLIAKAIGPELLHRIAELADFALHVDQRNAEDIQAWSKEMEARRAMFRKVQADETPVTPDHLRSSSTPAGEEQQPSAGSAPQSAPPAPVENAPVNVQPQPPQQQQQQQQQPEGSPAVVTSGRQSPTAAVVSGWMGASEFQQQAHSRPSATESPVTQREGPGQEQPHSASHDRHVRFSPGTQGGLTPSPPGTPTAKGVSPARQPLPTQQHTQNRPMFKPNTDKSGQQPEPSLLSTTFQAQTVLDYLDRDLYRFVPQAARAKIPDYRSIDWDDWIRVSVDEIDARMQAQFKRHHALVTSVLEHTERVEERAKRLEIDASVNNNPRATNLRHALEDTEDSLDRQRSRALKIEQDLEVALHKSSRLDAELSEARAQLKAAQQALQLNQDSLTEEKKRNRAAQESWERERLEGERTIRSLLDSPGNGSRTTNGVTGSPFNVDNAFKYTKRKLREAEAELTQLREENEALRRASDSGGDPAIRAQIDALKRELQLADKNIDSSLNIVLPIMRKQQRDGSPKKQQPVLDAVSSPSSTSTSGKSKRLVDLLASHPVIRAGGHTEVIGDGIDATLQAEEAESEVDRLRGVVRSRDNKIASIKEKNQKLKAKIQAVIVRNDQLEIELSQKRLDRSIAEDGAYSKSLDAKRVEAELEIAQEGLQRARAEIHELEQRRMEWHVERTSLLKKLASQSSQEASVEDALQEALNQVTMLLGQNQGFAAQLRDSLTNQGVLERSVASLREQNEALQAGIGIKHGLDRELTLLGSELRDTISIVTAGVERIKGVQSELDRVSTTSKTLAISLERHLCRKFQSELAETGASLLDSRTRLDNQMATVWRLMDEAIELAPKQQQRGYTQRVSPSHPDRRRSQSPHETPSKAFADFQSYAPVTPGSLSRQFEEELGGKGSWRRDDPISSWTKHQRRKSPHHHHNIETEVAVVGDTRDAAPGRDNAAELDVTRNLHDTSEFQIDTGLANEPAIRQIARVSSESTAPVVVDDDEVPVAVGNTPAEGVGDASGHPETPSDDVTTERSAAVEVAEDASFVWGSPVVSTGLSKDTSSRPSSASRSAAAGKLVVVPSKSPAISIATDRGILQTPRTPPVRGSRLVTGTVPHPPSAPWTAGPHSTVRPGTRLHESTTAASAYGLPTPCPALPRLF